MREQFVVPSIRSREVARAQRSGVWRCEDALQQHDFGNRLFGVHSVSMIQQKRRAVKRRGISKDRDGAIRPQPVDPPTTASYRHPESVFIVVPSAWWRGAPALAGSRTLHKRSKL